jgi:deoxycytidylate deaminase
MEYNIPQSILERLREEKEKSLSHKRKVGCIIYCQQNDIILAGHNQRITESLTLSQPDFIKQWYAETKKRATLYDKEDFVHAETMACYDSYRRKLAVEDYHYIRNMKKAVKVYVTHKPCKVCEKYLNEFFNEPIIEAVDLDKKKAFIKHDNGKTQYQYLISKFIKEMAEVTTQGAKKYGRDNYLQGDEQALNRIYDALMRHLMAWRMGEEVDPESGESHLSHVACNAMMIYALEHKLKLTGEKV